MKLPLRYFAVLLAVVLLAAACGSDSDDTAAEDTGAEDTAAEDASGADEAPADDASAEDTPSTEGASLNIIGPWRASEADAFEEVLDGFRSSTGIEVTYEGVDDVLSPVATQIAAGSPPDLAILAVANGLFDFVDQGAVVALDEIEDDLTANFSSGWLDSVSADGHIYAVPTRANINSLLWFDPSAIDGDVPTTWSDFLAYCDGVAASGGNCTAGLGADTWTLGMLFQAIYVGANGAEQTSAIYTGEVPFTDASVVEAMNRFVTFYGDDYANGGSVGALGTGLVDGIALVFGESPDAEFVQAGSWAGGLAVNAINENLVDGETLDYVLFPGDAAGVGAVIGTTDVAVVLSDSPAAIELASYLASAEGQALFVPNGFTVANQNVDTAEFTGLLAQTADLLATSDVSANPASVMSNELNGQLTELLSAAILDPGSIESLLATLQATVEAESGG